MIGHPCAKSKPGFQSRACVRRTSLGRAKLRDPPGCRRVPLPSKALRKGKALSFPRSQPTTYFLIYYAYRYYLFQVRGGFSRQTASAAPGASGRMT